MGTTRTYTCNRCGDSTNKFSEFYQVEVKANRYFERHYSTEADFILCQGCCKVFRDEQREILKKYKAKFELR